MLRIARATIALILLVVAMSFVGPILTPAKGMLLYNSGNPTPDQQLVLEYVNRARANPIAEGQRLRFDIHEGLENDPANGCYGPEYVSPRPPLAMNPILLSVAQGHVQDMYNQNYFSHTDPNGTTAFQRMTNAGYNFLSAGEDMAAGTGMSATDLQDYMMEDFGTPCRPHRMNLLDIFPNQPATYQEIGVGYYEGSSGQAFITEDFGTSTQGPFLVGVVYNNAGGSNFYQEGEGIGGVTITPSSGSYYTISSSSGGYAIPIGTSGTITVTASGPGFGQITKTVTLTGANVKVDFTTQSDGETTSTFTSSTPIFTQTTSSRTTQSTTSTFTSTVSTSTQSSTISSITYSQTTASNYESPTITLNKASALPASVIHVSGSGFSPTDTACALTGNAVDSQSCSVSAGTLTAAFTVANVTADPYAITATGESAGDTATATLSVLGSASQTTMTNSSDATSTTTQGQAGDFVIIPSSPNLAITQGANGSDQITVLSINGFDSPITILTSWLGATPSGVATTISPHLAPNSGGQAISQLAIATNTTASPGSFTIRVTGTSTSVGHSVSTDIVVNIIPQQNSVPQTETTTTMTTQSSSTSSTTFSLPPQPTSCVVSSSTAGSSLAPLVQKLRIFRDKDIMRSESGRAFMMLFNSWYYSFSPQASAYLDTHPRQRELTGAFLFPMLILLDTTYKIYSVTSLFAGVEISAIVAGIFAASLAGLVYLAPIVIVCRRTFRRSTRSGRDRKRLLLWTAGSTLGLMIAYPVGSIAVSVAAANLILSAITISATFGPSALVAIGRTVASLGLRPLLFFTSSSRSSLRLASPGFESKH